MDKFFGKSVKVQSSETRACVFCYKEISNRKDKAKLCIRGHRW